MFDVAWGVEVVSGGAELWNWRAWSGSVTNYVGVRAESIAVRLRSAIALPGPGCDGNCFGTFQVRLRAKELK